jgi:hypothetical protein
LKTNHLATLVERHHCSKFIADNEMGSFVARLLFYENYFWLIKKNGRGDCCKIVQKGGEVLQKSEMSND